MGKEIYYTFLESPLGKIGVASSSQGVVCIELKAKETEFAQMLQARFRSQPIRGERENQKVVEELKAYFAGKLEIFTSRLDLRGSPFQLAVWNELRKIPYGQKMSYKDIASRLGKPRAYRAVGNANKANPIPILISCHRVIKSDGTLGGYRKGREMKEKLLQLEEATSKLIESVKQLHLRKITPAHRSSSPKRQQIK